MSFQELLEQKVLTRAQLQEMIDSILPQTRQEDVRSCISQQLQVESMPFPRRCAIVDGVRDFLLRRQDHVNLTLQDAARCAALAVSSSEFNAASNSTPISSAISALDALSAAEWQPIREQYSTSFLHALFAVVFYEQQLSSLGSQSQEEST